MTRGGAWPDGGCAPVGLLSSTPREDGLDDTVRPRLDALSADVTKVSAIADIDGVAGRLSLKDDLEGLEALLVSSRAVLCVIDPLNAVVAGVNSHRASDMREVLAPLTGVAERTGATILVVHHLNKGETANALYRATGSLDIVAAARSVWLLAADPDDRERRLLLNAKLNLGKPAPNLAFRISTAESSGTTSP